MNEVIRISNSKMKFQVLDKKRQCVIRSNAGAANSTVLQENTK
jgi:hypothetical protein